jgi:plastocyanin
MSTQTIEIKTNPNRSPSQPGIFSPQAAVVNVGDNVIWANNDIVAHWPAPSASDPSAWIEYQIPPVNSSRGDFGLGANATTVVTASNATAVVFTTNLPGPPNGASVRITNTAPTTSPWSAVKGTLVATYLGPNSCSIPFNTSTFGPYPTGTIVLTILAPYTLKYVCALHPAETGTITVNPQL